MIKPARLKRGDTVAIVSLSSGLGGEEAFLHRYQRGKQRLEEVFGLNVVTMPHALKGIEFLYDNPALRAKDLMDAFRNPDIKGIICMIGGDDAIRLLPYVDFDVIRENPKVFMGYSDTTANHFMMQKAGVVSFYGGCIMVEFAENVAMHDYTIQHIKNVIFEPTDHLEIKPSPVWTGEYLEWSDKSNCNIARTMTPDLKGYELLQGKGVSRGKLLGGCLDVLPMIVGSKIWPSGDEWDNALLFLETSEVHPSPDHIKWILRGLTAQGITHRIGGIIFGKPCGEKFYEEYKTVLMQVAKEAHRPDMPILYNVNFGHTAPICVLPYGITAEIDCNTKSLRLLETPVL